MLPPTFMVSAGFNRYVVFTCEHVNTNVRLKSVIKPGSQLSGLLEGDGAVIERGEYINERLGGDKKYYSLKVVKLNRWLQGSKIYEYTVNDPCLCLPIEFHSVYVGKDTSETWHLLAKSVIVAQPIPPHVLKGFVNGLIAAKETCPVTMEELTLGNIAVTGCYHAFERSTMDQIMSTTRICPTCRSPLTENILM
jgi:hypothetical protein